MGDPGIKWVTGVRCAYEESNRILRSGHEKIAKSCSDFFMSTGTILLATYRITPTH